MVSVQRVEIQPSTALEGMLERAIRRAIQGSAPAPRPAPVGDRLANCKPIKIDTPRGPRIMFVDEINESHWVTDAPEDLTSARAMGWRQVFTLE